MEQRKRWARALAGVCLVGGLVVGLAVPASATEFTGSGPIQPGQTVEMGCYAWERFVSGSVTFYRREGAKKPIATVPFTVTFDGLGGQAVAPKGAHWWTGTIQCEPAPVTVALDETVTLEGEQEALISCPSGYWLDQSSVIVEVLSGRTDVQYTVFETSVLLRNPHPGAPGEATMVVRVTGTCYLPL
jgi:hypothetical protein